MSGYEETSELEVGATPIIAANRGAAGFFEIDQNGVVIKFSANFAAITGIASKRQDDGIVFSELSIEPDQARLEKCVKQVKTGNCSSVEFLGQCGTRQGLLRAVLEPILDVQQNVVGAQGVIEDISNQAEIDKRLIYARKLEILGKLTGGISHDFNNVLAVIIGSLERVIEGAGSAERNQKRVERAFRSAENGAGLVQQLLCLNPKTVTIPEHLSVQELMTEILPMVKRVMGDTIDIELQNLAPSACIYVDKKSLISAFCEIAQNSKDAMPDGGVLSINATAVELPEELKHQNAIVQVGKYVAFDINDNGVGISAAGIDRIFDRFYTTKKIEEGCGLGMVMVKDTINQSGGYLTVDSKLEGGTSVRIYMPDVLHEEQIDDGGDAVNNAHGALDKTIILVDDEDAVRDATASTLTNLGCKVYEAESGQSALKILDDLDAEGITVDLVFSDIAMPFGMNGYDLAREIIAKSDRLKILLTSGFSGALTNVEGESDEFSARVHFLPKPFKRAKLKEVLCEMMDGDVVG
jgi:PAS domain S-box-containing protein